MPYDTNLASRVRTILEKYPGWVEKKMFGGVGFILRGNMACGVQGDDLLVRVGAESNEAALSRPNVRPFMAMPEKTMAGWVVVAGESLVHGSDLQYWVSLGYDYASTLPAKD